MSSAHQGLEDAELVAVGVGEHVPDPAPSRPGSVGDKLADSGPGSYTFADHRHHLDGWFESIGAEVGVVLVLHDCGSALGFDWARRHPDRVRGIAYMEAIVRPLDRTDLAPSIAELFDALRSPAGEALVLEGNLFIEGVLAASTASPLAADVIDEYRRPFATAGEGRRPMLSWARQVPIDGDPADVADVVARYSDWMAATPLPKLFSRPTTWTATSPGFAIWASPCPPRSTRPPGDGS